VGLLAAWLLVSDRLWLTSERWYGVWPGVLLGGALFAGAVGVAGGWLFRRAQVPWHPWQRRALLALMMVVFAVRLAGQLHPQIFIVDLNFHAHRFETVQSGQLLFTIRSAEWGGHETFYLPTAYVFMLPLQWVAHDELLVIKLFTVAASTLGGFVVYYVARRALRDGWAGLIAAALYLLLPIAVLPFSWGITTNIFGELFALLSLAIVVTGYHDLHPTRPALWGLLFCLLMALLSHPGVVQLTLVAFTFISLLWFFAGRIIGGRRLSLAVLGTLALAFGVAFAVYYSNFAESMFKTLQQIQAERASSSTGGLHLKIGGSVADKSLGLVVRFVDNRRDWLLGGLRGFWQEAQGYYQVWPVAGALLGYVAAWPGREPLRRMYLVPERISEKARLVIAAGGWSLTVALFALVGWAMNLYVRYALFALPVVAIGAGYLLSRVARRGHSGVWLSALVLAYFGAQALALWGYRITYAFK
jgi:hypothetical protein